MSKFMLMALEEAKKAYDLKEVPIGAVIVKNGEVIARAHNHKEYMQKATAHAEILCIEEASRILGSWYLDECEMYVTIEPCAMCAGAIVNARIKKVYYGAKEKKFGAHDSVVHILENKEFNHFVEVESGLMEEKASLLMREFFKNLRK